MSKEIIADAEVFFSRVSDPSLAISSTDLFGDNTAVIVFIKSCSFNTFPQNYQWHIGFIGGVGEFNSSFLPKYEEMYADGMIRSSLAKSAKGLTNYLSNLFQSAKPLKSLDLHHKGYGAYCWDERDYNLLTNKEWYLETTRFGSEKYYSTVVVNDDDAIKMVEEALHIKKSYSSSKSPYGTSKVWLGRPYKTEKSVLSPEFMNLILKRHESKKVAA